MVWNKPGLKYDLKNKQLLHYFWRKDELLTNNKLLCGDTVVTLKKFRQSFLNDLHDS